MVSRTLPLGRRSIIVISFFRFQVIAQDQHRDCDTLCCARKALCRGVLCSVPKCPGGAPRPSTLDMAMSANRSAHAPFDGLRSIFLRCDKFTFLMFRHSLVECARRFSSIVGSPANSEIVPGFTLCVPCPTFGCAALAAPPLDLTELLQRELAPYPLGH